LNNTPLEILSDFATEAHAKIQQDFENINPVVGLTRGMRKIGIPADAMTIDCLKSGKRIILVLHDEQPETLKYQFSFKADEPDEVFENMCFDHLTVDQLYRWMRDYFS
jgi:hypothetical protein